MSAEPTPRRARRHDPERRDRLIDAALTVIADRGVAGTTHREIARAADVPLGSMTYHFTGIHEVLVEAFTRHAESVAAVCDQRLAAAADRDEAVEAVITLVSAGVFGSSRDLVLTVELYAAAARPPALARRHAGVEGAQPASPRAPLRPGHRPRGRRARRTRCRRAP
jgi:TetR/AcrR family transcriptional regulator, regulator of biofilm formation and stress response